MLVARLVAAALVGSSGGCGNSGSGGDGDNRTTASVMSEVGRARARAMVFAVEMVLLVEMPVAVARV